MKGKHNLAVYFIVSYSDGNCSNSKNDDAAFCWWWFSQKRRRASSQVPWDDVDDVNFAFGSTCTVKMPNVIQSFSFLKISEIAQK